jgi:adenosylcobinamide kinase/adenosylcobinamide-phosphate guanylyltransferase
LSRLEGVTILLGGARSGKSDLACRLAAAGPAPVTFLATAEAGDDEMAARIARHRAERPAGWATVEEPISVVAAVQGVDPERTLLLDCVTLWVANLTGAGWDDAAIEAEAGRLAGALADRSGASLVVANEIGWGLVPADPASRRFRDVHGRVNRALAQRADAAVLVVAGRVVPLVEPSRYWGLDV